jgi:nitroreductase
MECSFDEAVRRRRSIRKYDGRDIPDSGLIELLDLARRAPSSMDGQACCFVLVRNRATCEKLAQIKNLPKSAIIPPIFSSRRPSSSQYVSKGGAPTVARSRMAC